ncbi:MAG: hypothetical protein R3F55_12230 [Alphaproteobacteria bacterium]
MTQLAPGTAAVVAALALAACTDPTKYAEPLATLNTATGQTAAVVEDVISPFEDTPDSRRQACLAAAVMSGDALDRSLIDPSSGRCAEIWAKAQAGFAVDAAQAAQRRAAMDALTAYVGALQAVLEAEDGDPLRAAAFDAEYRGRTLAAAAEALPGAAAMPRPAEAVTMVGDLLAGVYGDLARIEALRAVVAGTDPAVAQLAAALAADVAAAHAARLARGPQEIEATIALFNRTGAGDRYAAGELAVALSNNLDALRASDPSEALRRLEIAHAALAQALDDDTPKSFIELVDRVERFAEAAGQAEAVYVAYNAALEG